MSAALPLRSFRRPQHLRSSAPPPFPSHASTVPGRSRSRMACRDHGSLTSWPSGGSARPDEVNVTMPLNLPWADRFDDMSVQARLKDGRLAMQQVEDGAKHAQAWNGSQASADFGPD